MSNKKSGLMTVAVLALCCLGLAACSQSQDTEQLTGFYLDDNSPYVISPNTYGKISGGSTAVQVDFMRGGPADQTGATQNAAGISVSVTGANACLSDPNVTPSVTVGSSAANATVTLHWSSQFPLPCDTATVKVTQGGQPVGEQTIHFQYNAFFSDWGATPNLPDFSDAVQQQYGLDKNLLAQVFQHSFNLNRTIYQTGNPFNRPPDYWFKQIDITPMNGVPAGEPGDVYYQMLTGDISAMWARDSMWQIIPYILYAKSDPTSADACDAHPATPSLRCLARGTILSLAYFFIHDPYQTDNAEPGAYFGIYKGANRSNESGSGFPLAMTQAQNACTLSGVTYGPISQDEWVLIQPNGNYKSSSSVEGYSNGCNFANQENGLCYIFDSRYEPDGMASWVLAVLQYNKEYPDEHLLQHPWVTAAMKDFVAIVKTETDHDADSPYLNVANLSDGGKGASVRGFDADTDDAVLTWVGFRPSDDPTLYGYNIPGNLYVATALDSLANAYADSAVADSMAQTIGEAGTLAQKIANGVAEYGTSTVQTADGGTMTVYDYEVNGYAPGDSQRKVWILDDANYPNLQALPLLVSPKFFNMAIYNNTMKYISGYYSDAYQYSTADFQNYWFDSAQTSGTNQCTNPPAIRYQGLGSSVRTSGIYPHNVWPMAIVMDAWMQTRNGETLDPDQFWQDMQQLQGFLKTQNNVLSFPESFDVCDPGNNPTRNDDSFGWMAATYVLFARGWFTPEITPYGASPETGD